ncbi:MAG: CHAD domain-containing protein [Caldimonas sp.]
MTTETELKFAVAADTAIALESALRKRGATMRTIRSRYFDTEDGRLAEAHLALRLRKAGGAWEQTLKAPGPSAIEREEESVARPGKWGNAGPEVDPALHATTRAGKALDAVLRESKSGPGALLPVHENVFKRLAVDVESGGASIEVGFDRGTILAAQKSAPISEIEYELKAGPAAALIAFAKADVVEYGLWLSTISKAQRADRLTRGVEAGAPIKEARPHLPADADGRALYRAIVAACLAQIVANAAEIGEGARDDELVHQLRIGIRRLRTAARELAALAASADRAWEPALADAFRALGRYRDGRTVAPVIEARLQAAGSPRASVLPASVDLPDPVAVVRAAPFQLALLDLLALTLDPATVAADTADHAATKRLIVKRLDRLRRGLRRDAARFEELDEDGRHRVRKRLKRLRYLSELVEPLHPRRRVKAYLAALKPAQDAVGEHIDQLLSRRTARAVSEGEDAKAWFDVGWLSAEVAHSAKRACKALTRAGKAPAFW